MNIWKKYLELLYPQTCYFCGKNDTKNICDECAKKIEYLKEPRCKKCGKPIRYAEKEWCYDCENRIFYYEQGRSLWLHKGPVRWSVYQFKYHNRRIYGEFYAKEMYRLYGELVKSWGIDVIIPIPLHKKRKRKRGYNQAEIIAKHFGKLTGIPVESRTVVRIRNTAPQKELTHDERKKNLRESFRVTRGWKGYKNVLLVDDIYTTGNTIDSVAKTLKEKGVHKVWFLTISIGQGF